MASNRAPGLEVNESSATEDAPAASTAAQSLTDASTSSKSDREQAMWKKPAFQSLSKQERRRLGENMKRLRRILGHRILRRKEGVNTSKDPLVSLFNVILEFSAGLEKSYLEHEETPRDLEAARAELAEARQNANQLRGQLEMANIRLSDAKGSD